MAEYSKLVTTSKGQQLLVKSATEMYDVKFTKICISDMVYTENQLESLTILDDIRQTGTISKISRVDSTIKVETVLTNTNLSNGYYMRTLGLYANDPDEGEILYAACVATDDNCYMPPYSGISSTGIYINMYQTVGNTSNISLEVDSGAYATIGDIEELRQMLNNHIETAASKTVPGHVKVDEELSNTSDNPVQNKAVSAAIDTKLDKTGDIQDNTVTFQNDDNVDVIVEESLSGGVTSTEYILTDKTWHEVEPIKAKEKLGSVFGKISTLFHNVRYLYKMLGTTDISQIDSGSNGTITSIISRPDVKLKYGSFLIKVPGQSTIDYDIMDDAEIERQTPSGYKFVCCLIDRGGYADQWMINISRYGGGLRALIQSRNADELSAAVCFFMLFVKESIFPET